MVLDINPILVYPMIDRMLGGGRVPISTCRRPLTRIELRLVQRIIDEFLKELRVTWQKMVEMELTIAQTDSNPLCIQVCEPQESVIVLCFEVWLSEVSGSITLCIPVDVFHRLKIAKEGERSKDE